MGYLTNGYVVHCITSSKYQEEINEYCRSHSQENLHFYFTDNTLSLKLLKIPAIGIYLHYYAWLIKARSIIKSLISATSFSHAHHVTYSSIKFGTPLYKIGIPVILGPLGGGILPHRSLKPYLGKHYYSEYVKNAIGNVLSNLNPMVSRSIKNADLILVSNQIAENTIRKYTSKKAEKMFDAGLADYFERSFKSRSLRGTIHILWIGRMLPRKGLNLALEAVAQLPKDLTYHFYIAGEGPMERPSRLLVDKLGIISKVTFLGKVPHDQLESILETSHILLFPSLIDSCPMQVFEAMAYGLPIVTLDHQGMRDQVVKGTGIKIPVGHSVDYPQELAAGICKLVQNQETYDAYSFKAWETGQKQIWKSRIRTFLDTYKKSVMVSLF